MTEPVSRTRRFALAATAAALGMLTALLVLELVLRMLPVRESLEAPAVTPERPYLRFRPNSDIVYSAHWNFAIANKVHVNNFGFVNDQDYDPALTVPLLAVIGDSYVEALMVPYADTLHGRLAKVVGAQGRVYSFGTSGSALAQYLAYAKFVRNTFRPDAMIFIVVGNDFDESLLEYKSSPGFHYFRGTLGGGFELHLVPFEPSFLGRALRWSALARYLNYNLQLAGPRRWLLDGRHYAGNVPAEANVVRLERSRLAIANFLEVLPQHSGLPPERIAILLDGIRPQLYDKQALVATRDSYFAQMRTHFLRLAADKGYVIVDMQPRFIARYRNEGRRFEWPFDGHWNSLGHEEAALAVLSSRLLQSTDGHYRLRSD